jgi:predicted DNA-binding transcriptional regulator YafY
MPSENALERVERIIDLIPYLHHRQVNLGELASRLGQDVAEIERDLEIAFLCGLPGYTPDLLIDMSMEDGLVAVSDPQSLDVSRRLTIDEITSLRLGVELIQMLYPSTNFLREHLDSLRRKINEPSEASKELTFDDERNENLEVIESAMLMPSRISFSYLDSLGRLSQQRLVTPSNFFWRGGRLLLRGFDHEKESAREFFISRVKNVQPAPGQAVSIEEPDSSSAAQSSLAAVIRLSALPMWWKRRNAAFITNLDTNPSGVRVELRYWSEEWLIRALVPILDLIESIDAEGLSSDQLRTLFLSHFSGSDTPV